MGSIPTAAGSDGPLLDVRTLAAELQRLYTRDRTLTATVQGEVLQTLGLLLEAGGQASGTVRPCVVSDLSQML